MCESIKAEDSIFECRLLHPITLLNKHTPEVTNHSSSWYVITTGTAFGVASIVYEIAVLFRRMVDASQKLKYGEAFVFATNF